MESSNFSPEKTAAHQARPILESRLVHAARIHRRRLDDALEEAFNRACAVNNLGAATDLLVVLEKWHGKSVNPYGSERRINDTNVKSMRADLDRLTASRLS
jgi:hypothetical protein